MTQCNFVIRKQIMKDEHKSSMQHMTIFVRFNMATDQDQMGKNQRQKSRKTGSDPNIHPSLEAYDGDASNKSKQNKKMRGGEDDEGVVVDIQNKNKDARPMLWPQESSR